MALYFIGLGLYDEKDISLRGLEAIKRCDVVYLENYTSMLSCDVKKLEKLYGKNIILSSRELVENKAEDTILKDALSKDVAFLVIGDPMSATTHIDLRLRAEKAGIGCIVVHNASVFSAVGVTGLQLYKFGRTTSIPFQEEKWHPETPYDAIKENMNSGLHTLILLDLRPDEKKFMTVNQAIEYLLSIEDKRKEKVFSKELFCVGCARIGSLKPCIKAGNAEELLKENFGKPVHCLIVPGKLHFAEEEALELFKIHK
ncbi:MAG: diphthine synthase [Nanoarchaeota archaeon]|nr:diphthine synthase [Nanoarchaeota archaeon]MBU4493509.1 diphthine synthase [Nanoarchaeota archaeon]